MTHIQEEEEVVCYAVVIFWCLLSLVTVYEVKSISRWHKFQSYIMILDGTLQ